jgi:hypothetical protein
MSFVLFVFLLCIVPSIICVSGLFIRDCTFAFSNVYYTPARRELGVYRDPHVRPSVRHTFGFRIIIKVPLNQIFSNFHSLLCTIKYRLTLITVYFTFTVYGPFLSENRDFLGFRMIFKVWFDQIFSTFNTMLWTIKYRLSSITVYFTFTVHELWPFFS